MIDLKSRVIVSLEDFLGYEVGYEKISPSFLSFFEIRNLTLTHPSSGEQLLQIRNLKLFYNPLTYFLNRTENVLISNINITGLTLSFNPERDSRLMELFTSDGTDNPSSGTRELSRYFSGRIRIRSWSFHYISSEDKIHFEGNTITLKQQKDYMRIKLNGYFNLTRSGTGGPLDRIMFNVSVNGNLHNDLRGFNLVGDFRDVHSNLFDIDRQELNIRYDGTEFNLAKVRDRQPYDLNLIFADETFSVDFNAEQFSPEKIIALKGPLENLNPWLSTVFSGTGHFDMSLSGSEMHYSYDGTAFIDNEIIPFPVNAEILASGNDRILIADNLTVSTAYGTYSFSGEWSFLDKFPMGNLAFYQMPVAGDLTLNGELSLEEVEDYFFIRSENLELSSGLNPGNLKVLISRAGENYVYSLRSELNHDNQHKNQILLNGEFSFTETFRLKSTYTVNQLSLQTLQTFFPDYRDMLSNPLLSGLVIQTNGSVIIDGRDYYIRLQEFGIRSPDENRNLKCRGFCFFRRV